jgi:uncharacterized repeat protein (TIGR03806 family)
MRHKIKFLLIHLCLSVFLINCSSDDTSPLVDDDDPVEVSPVVYDLNAIPYPKLSDYNFFKSPMKDLQPVYGVLPFRPASQLFTDYASKSRFIWMPEGAKANYVAEDKIFDFPEGTMLIKNFYYDNVLPSNTKKIIETRLIIKKGSEYIFANYVWNEDQSEAYFDLDGSFIPLEFSHNGQTKEVFYRIPSQSECLTCHKTLDNAIPIGPKPMNLNFNLTYADGSENQIDKWEYFGYLNLGTPSNISTTVDYNDASKSLDERFRSYADINCAHCHNPNGHCNYLPINLVYTQTADPANLGICVVPNIDISGFIGVPVTHIVKPGDPTSSNMYQRIKSVEENIRMPMMGRSLVHEEAVNLTEQWINSLSGNCN